MAHLILKDQHFHSEISLKRQETKQLLFLCRQQEVKEWIEEVLQIKLPHDDLYVCLKDGVILGKLMLKISPGCMKEPTRTVKTFKMMQNVETFVKAMEGYGVKSLFTPTELINKTNMMNVVMSLQDLAEVAALKGFIPVLKRTDELPSPDPSKTVSKIGEERVGHLKGESELKNRRRSAEFIRMGSDEPNSGKLNFVQKGSEATQINRSSNESVSKPQTKETSPPPSVQSEPITLSQFELEMELLRKESEEEEQKLLKEYRAKRSSNYSSSSTKRTSSSIDLDKEIESLLESSVKTEKPNAEKNLKEEQKRKEEEEAKLELQRVRQELEKVKLELEMKKKEEEERKRIELEEKLRKEEVEKKIKEEHEKIRLELEQKKREEEEKARLELEQKKKEEEERIRIELEKKKREEEERIRIELEKKKKEEEEKIKLEEQKKEEEKIRLEIEKKKKEEEKVRLEPKKKKKEEKERAKLELEKKKREEEEKAKLELERKKREDDERVRLELEKKKREEEEKAKLELERKKREEDERVRLELEKKKKEEEKLKLEKKKQEEEKLRLEAERKKKEEDGKQIQEKKKKEDEENRKLAEEQANKKTQQKKTEEIKEEREEEETPDIDSGKFSNKDEIASIDEYDLRDSIRITIPEMPSPPSRSSFNEELPTSQEEAKELLEQERSYRKLLEDWKQTHSPAFEALQSELKELKKVQTGLHKKHQNLVIELENLESKLQTSSLELETVVKNKEASDLSSEEQMPEKDKRKSSTVNESKFSSFIKRAKSKKKEEKDKQGSLDNKTRWNKKAVFDAVQLGKELSQEKRTRRELEIWKEENEGKIEELQNKLANEIEARKQAEETLKRLTRELESLE